MDILIEIVDTEEMTKFWKSSTSRSGSRNLKKGFFDIARQDLFPHFDSYLWKN